MSNHVDNLVYLRRVSRKTKRGILYHDAWHYGCDSHGQRGRQRYKNIARTSIRKAK